MNPLFLYIYNIFSNYITPLTAIFPVYFAFKNYPSLTSPFKILFAFIVVSSLFNAANLIAIGLYHVQTVKWIPVYTVLEFSFIALVFSRVYNKKWCKYFYALIITFAAVCAYNAIFIQNKVEFNTYTRPVGALLIIAFCMNYIIKTGTLESKWTDNNFNWINIGLLLYYSAGLIMFTFSNYFLKLNTLTLTIWTIHDTILITEYILFGIGFYKSGIAYKSVTK
ncbi:hypothetical protein D0C36_21130 [Mucilaginibacter conchicola]|uniref:YhhN-like protein n=1 Tax=Mucilaginibacter conchicola TaxID=2303333 RepID=A0A372NMY3_9SPHI|nr:hypothetical protein [Mucilaginibacter conchicola]RFZ90304.1 hypothetical protein D0C36_21130 [Mucilaginibacter conchicola]